MLLTSYASQYVFSYLSAYVFPFLYWSASRANSISTSRVNNVVVIVTLF